MQIFSLVANINKELPVWMKQITSKDYNEHKYQVLKFDYSHQPRCTKPPDNILSIASSCLAFTKSCCWCMISYFSFKKHNVG